MTWIPRAQQVYLRMDNAGGRGAKNVIREYTQQLVNTGNVVVKQQPARLPETTSLGLGLGLWMRVLLPSAAISHLFERTPVVLQLIVHDDSRENDKLDERCGQSCERTRS